MPILLKISVALAALVAGAFTVAIAFVGPKPMPPMASINNPFKAVDFSDLPPLLRYKAEDGTALAYRRYAPEGGGPKGSVVIVHGSSASSNSMHVLGTAFAKPSFSTGGSQQG